MADDNLEIFISYKRGGESETMVDELCSSFEERDVSIIRDVDELGYNQRIEPFMERIGNGRFVILIISKAYLESKYCMFELLAVAKNENWGEIIHPIVLDDANIFESSGVVSYKEFWINKKTSLAEEQDITAALESSEIRREFDFFKNIHESIESILPEISAVNSLTPTEHRTTNFQALFDNINEKYQRYLAEGIIKDPSAVNIAKDEIGHGLHLKCNRVPQKQIFHQSFGANIQKNCKMHVYAMHCNRDDEPESMVERFRAELIQEHIQKKLLKIVIKRDLEDAELKSNIDALKYDLANQCDKLKYDLESSELTALAKKRSSNAVVVSYRLSIKNWDEVTQKTIQWLVKDFWNTVPVGKDDPHFILFFNFVLSEIEEKGFLGFFNKNKPDKVKKAISKLLTDNSIHEVVFLPDPKKITEKDVKDWAEENQLYFTMTDAIDKLIKKIFKGKQKKVFMREILGPLSKLIRSFQS